MAGQTANGQSPLVKQPADKVGWSKILTNRVGRSNSKPTKLARQSANRNTRSAKTSAGTPGPISPGTHSPAVLASRPSTPGRFPLSDRLSLIPRHRAASPFRPAPSASGARVLLIQPNPVNSFFQFFSTRPKPGETTPSSRLQTGPVCGQMRSNHRPRPPREHTLAPPRTIRCLHTVSNSAPSPQHPARGRGTETPPRPNEPNVGPKGGAGGLWPERPGPSFLGGTRRQRKCFFRPA